MERLEILTLVGGLGYHVPCSVEQTPLCLGLEEDVCQWLSQLSHHTSLEEFWLSTSVCGSHHVRLGLCVPGEAHPAGWDYAAVVRQTGARSVYLRGGS